MSYELRQMLFLIAFHLAVFVVWYFSEKLDAVIRKALKSNRRFMEWLNG